MVAMYDRKTERIITETFLGALAAIALGGGELELAKRLESAAGRARGARRRPMRRKAA